MHIMPPSADFIISIHAPTRGATASCKTSERHPKNFNPRSHEGSDTGKVEKCGGARKYFNPRSHEGSDRENFIYVCLLVNFNPRSHEGSDSLHGADRSWSIISIHAPTRGATSFICCSMLLHLISIHAPTRGATAPWE